MSPIIDPSRYVTFMLLVVSLICGALIQELSVRTWALCWLWSVTHCLAHNVLKLLLPMVPVAIVVSQWAVDFPAVSYDWLRTYAFSCWKSLLLGYKYVAIGNYSEFYLIRCCTSQKKYSNIMYLVLCEIRVVLV